MLRRHATVDAVYARDAYYGDAATFARRVYDYAPLSRHAVTLRAAAYLCLRQRFR